MNKREEVRAELARIKNHSILLELPTSFGKSAQALYALQDRVSTNSKILIIVPRLVLIDNWKDEFKKWKCLEYLKNTTFVTYVSLPKITDSYDLIIADEAHHLSQRCQEALLSINYKDIILLSATISKKLRESFNVLFKDLYIVKVSIRDAVNNDILPDPKVYLLPLSLDNTKVNCEIIKNRSKGNPIITTFAMRWNYSKEKNRKIVIKCTQRQWYQDCTSLIEWYKNRSYNEIMRNNFLRKSGERLKWLSNQKSEVVKEILAHLKNYRTLTFCNSIDQTKLLGKYCINSKNDKSREYLEMFNSKKIKHITACNILDEGVNLKDCQVGIYAVLNSSERMILQKSGRILRHKNPVFIIPYYKGTREEEIVNKMYENYNPALVQTIHSVTDIKL